MGESVHWTILSSSTCMGRTGRYHYGYIYKRADGYETMKIPFSTRVLCAKPYPVLQYMTMSGVLQLRRLQEPGASLQFGSAPFTPLMPLNTGAIYCQEKSGTDIGNDRFRSCVPRSALTPLAKKMLVENVIFEIHSTSAKRTETWSQKETHHSNPGRKRV